MHVGPIPANILFDDVELAEIEQSTREEDNPVHVCPMTFRQHLRAFARWWSPWEEDTREALLAALGFYCCLITVGLVLRSKVLVYGVSSLAILLVKWFLMWRTVITLLSLALYRIGGREQARETWRTLWREKAQEPLFPRYRLYRLKKRWLRDEGYSRREARREA